MDISFVFSNAIKYRVARHVAFWVVMFAYQALVDFIVPTFFEGATYNVLKESLFYVMVYLPGQLLLVYCILYIVIPHYLIKGHYVSGVFLLICFCFLAGFTNELSYRFFTSGHFVLFPSDNKHSLGMHRMLGVAGCAACIKFMKFWYEKRYVNSILEKEKLNAELQSLKAQVHPHFLFNTLNNIYGVVENTSPQGSDMILRLSALLRYILYECNNPFIRLGQEFKIIHDYIALERARYSDTLDLQVELPGNADGYLIAPLLLLPLVENCFKHGTSRVLEHPWINIQASLKGSVLNIKLMNGKPDHVPADTGIEHGIGLTNVKKRLDLLYPGRHELKILPDEGMFVVALKIELEKASILTNGQAA